jgi:acyl carrier protein
MTIHESIRGYIAGELAWDGPVEKLTNDYPLLDNEVVDSLGIFKIISFIESEYDIEIADEELIPENFQTIDSIAQLISDKVG